MIGDPSGRNSERELLNQEILEKNKSNLKQTLLNCLGENRFTYVDNLPFYQNFSVLEFLRNVGKDFRVNQMLKKDSVKSRLDSLDGISFTEFSYQIFQAYDFMKLNELYDCRLQCGGSDQYLST